jgi:hypothetical protein
MVTAKCARIMHTDKITLAKSHRALTMSTDAWSDQHVLLISGWTHPDASGILALKISFKKRP